MKTHILVELVCAACLATVLTGCEDKKYGCRADATCIKIAIKNKGKGCEPRTYAFHKPSIADAVSAAKDKYQEEYPDSEPSANCWDCSRTDLDKAAKQACAK